jgi:hypothetical protein
MAVEPDGSLKAKVKVDDAEPVKVQLSGNRVVKEEILIPRQVYTDTVLTPYVSVPDGARGFDALLFVHGITGVFSEDQGVWMEVSQRPSAGLGTRVLRNVYTAYEKITRAHNTLWYPNVGTTDFDQEATLITSATTLMVVPLPAYQQFVFSVSIQGQFSQGEGVDCQLIVKWLS